MHEIKELLEQLRNRIDNHLSDKRIKTKLDDAWGQWRIVMFHRREELCYVTCGTSGLRLRYAKIKGRDRDFDVNDMMNLIAHVRFVIDNPDTDYNE
jgi:hypothetical protein